MSEEWRWAAAICGVPFLIFGLVEAVVKLRRRRAAALARRPKGGAGADETARGVTP